MSPADAVVMAAEEIVEDELDRLLAVAEGPNWRSFRDGS